MPRTALEIAVQPPRLRVSVPSQAQQQHGRDVRPRRRCGACDSLALSTRHADDEAVRRMPIRALACRIDEAEFAAPIRRSEGSGFAGHRVASFVEVAIRATKSPGRMRRAFRKERGSSLQPTALPARARTRMASMLRKVFVIASFLLSRSCGRAWRAPSPAQHAGGAFERRRSTFRRFRRPTRRTSSGRECYVATKPPKRGGASQDSDETAMPRQRTVKSGAIDAVGGLSCVMSSTTDDPLRGEDAFYREHSICRNGIAGARRNGVNKMQQSLRAMQRIVKFRGARRCRARRGASPPARMQR